MCVCCIVAAVCHAANQQQQPEPPPTSTTTALWLLRGSGEGRGGALVCLGKHGGSECVCDCVKKEEVKMLHACHVLCVLLLM